MLSHFHIYINERNVKKNFREKKRDDPKKKDFAKLVSSLKIPKRQREERREGEKKTRILRAVNVS